jgi:hypothetical protein
MSKRFPTRGLLVGATLVLGLGVGYAIGAQPRMEAALGLLENARGELEGAAHDKGGHRLKAMELIDEAIQQVREGMTFAE